MEKLRKCEQCQKEKYANEIKPVVRGGFEEFVCDTCRQSHGTRQANKRESARAKAWSDFTFKAWGER